MIPNGHRGYSCYNLRNFSSVIDGGNNKEVIAYSRVSSHGQKDDLKRQSFVLDKFCIKEFPAHEILEDLGRGMNYWKKCLKKLMTLILSTKVSDFVFTWAVTAEMITCIQS
jgi:putative resolvase